MTIEEAKKKYGREPDGYVSCYHCPLHYGCGLVAATGLADCWDQIARTMSEQQPENAVPTVDKLTRHEQICDEIKALYKRKNTDYGDSFHKTFVEEGMAMPRIRLTDKLERFKKLTKSGEQNVNDESIRDTLIDLANYAIMTILELGE